MVIYKLECNHTWDYRDATNTYTFGSLAGAQKWVKKHLDELRWYSIEGHEYLPCKDTEPGGRLYISLTYMEYHDRTEGDPVFHSEEDM